VIIAQGWKKGRVYVLAISRGQNGIDAWQAYRGSYANGETFADIQDWTCLNSSHDIVSLIYYHGFTEIASWVDGGKEVKNLQDVMLAIHEQCKTIAAYLKTCAPASETIPVNPWPPQ
jgi:hypothetical protein